jgi:hypothetical protein
MRNDSFMTDHGSTRDTASRTRRGPVLDDAAAGAGVLAAAGRAGVFSAAAGVGEGAAAGVDGRAAAAGVAVAVPAVLAVVVAAPDRAAAGVRPVAGRVVDAVDVPDELAGLLTAGVDPVFVDDCAGVLRGGMDGGVSLMHPPRGSRQPPVRPALGRR